MELLMQFIVNNFNIMAVTCSVSGCRENSHRKTSFYEYTLNGEKEIAALRLCKEHYKNVDEIIKELKSISPEKIICTKTSGV